MPDAQQTGAASAAAGVSREMTPLPDEEQEQDGWGSLDLPGFSDEGESFEDDLALTPRPPWWRRRWVLFTAAVVIVLAAVLTPLAISRAHGQPITYTTTVVQTGNLITTVSATGPLQSATYDVNFSGSGLIAEIDVNVGQQVKAGQVLAKLNPTSLQDAVNAAQTALNNAYNSRYNTDAQANAQVNASYQQEQSTILNTCDPMTDSAKQAACVNNAEAQYASARAQANASESSANAQVSSAQATLTTAQDNLSNAVLTAPHAGIVGSINGKVGGTPGSSGSSTSNSSSSGAFIEIVDLSSMQVVADVTEADIGKIVVGQTVTFTVSAYSTHVFHGTVSTISPLGQSTSNVVTYPVTINVDTTSFQGVTLLPEMTANATITTARRVGVLMIPASAITFARSEISSGAITRTDALNAFRQAAQMLQTAQSSDPTAAQDNLQATFVLERSNGKWVVKPIVIGLTNGTFYEVLAGLNADTAIVTGQQGGTTSSTTSGTTTGGGLFGGGGGRFGGGGGGSGGGRFGGGTNGGGTNGGGTNGGTSSGN